MKIVISWIARLLHQDPGKFRAAGLGTAELTDLKKVFHDFSKIQKKQWPALIGFQPSSPELIHFSDKIRKPRFQDGEAYGPPVIMPK